ncbi:MAG: hypothetical protein KKA42_04705, partial [candidate division Zixibacteria bacterium]|nr:hypothetical protein [candidate division Zixibacteria bacterium]
MLIRTSSIDGFTASIQIPSRLDNVERDSDRPSHVVGIVVPPGAAARLTSVSGGELRPLSGDVDVTPTGPDLSLATLSPVRMIRGRQIAYVVIHPVTSGGIYSEVEVAVEFVHAGRQPATETYDDPGFDRIFASSIANWDVARTWGMQRRSSTTAMPAAAADRPQAERWYKVSVASSGIHRITGSMLASAGINLTGLASSSIRMFSGGGLQVPLDNLEARPEFREIALTFADGGDGVFGAADEFAFYGEAVDRWVYQAGQAPVYVNNPYETINTYWLAVAGSFPNPALRMGSVDGTPTGSADTTITSFWSQVRVEQDNILARAYDNRVYDYYDWFWTDVQNHSVYAATPGAVTGDSCRVFVDAHTGGEINLTVNGVTAEQGFCSSENCQFTTRALLSGVSELNQFAMSMRPINVTDGVAPYFNYLNLSYHRQMLPVDDILDITLGDGTGGTAEVRIVDNFASEQPMVLNLDDPLVPVEIYNAQRSGGSLTFDVDFSATGPNRYYCASVDNIQTPVSIVEAEFTDLRSTPAQTDLIVVAARPFVAYLDEYLEYRRGQGHAIQVAVVDDIMDNFSHGLYDPFAIRDFLKFAYETYPGTPPSGVLFVGDANYDFLNHLGLDVPNYVPMAIRPNDRSYSDDNYVYFGNFGILDSDTTFDTTAATWDRGFDMMAARWPVVSRQDIDVIVNKIKQYESVQGHGSWRTEVCLVADDEHSGEDSHTEIIHARDTERLQADYIPPHFMRNKIYSWDYPLVNREKPDVNTAVVKSFNDGSLLINYVGHGNPDVWAHEHIFDRSSDLPRLSNAGRLPLVY